MTALHITDLGAIPSLSDPQLSPDGATVAYTVTTVSGDSYTSAIWVVASDGSSPARALTASGSSPRWSPDGTQLAFVDARGDGAAQLYVLPMGGGEARQVGELEGGAGNPQWSPDGASVAVTSLVRLSPTTEAHAPLVIDRLLYKADGAGLVRDRRMHLFVLDTATGSSRQLTAGDFSVSSQAWSPDGSQIAYAAGTSEDGDLTHASSVFVVPTVGGTPRAVTPAGHLLGGPTWYEDGQQLLVSGQERLASLHTRLYSVPLDGGAPKPVAVLDRNVMTGGPGYPGASPVVLSDGAVLFAARDEGCSHLYVADPDAEPTKVVGGPDRTVSGASTAAGLVAFLVADATSNGEVHIAALDGSDEKCLTSHFADALPDVALPVAESRWFTSPDGTRVQGWTLRDPALSGRTPLLLDVHGGPHNAWAPAFDGVHLYHQALVAQGWTVLILNPRASDGYGEDFFRATAGEWGVADDQDFLAPIDALIAEGLVDAAKVVVTGYSYGGYMSCWLSARHPDRWAAAIPGGCVSDQLSLAGTSDAGGYLAVSEFGTEKAGTSSPLTYVGDVTAPTLLLHGEADDRCPVGQSEQWFGALRGRDVPVELVRYPGGSHLFILNGRPSHRMDWCSRIVEWALRHTSGTVRPARRLSSRTAGLQSRLEQLIAQHRVPGAVVSVLHGDEVVTAAAGVRSLDTKDPVTADTLFQIGSNTKLYTATLVMQLVDKGLVDLDAPVQTYLPSFTLADEQAAATITVRHLLTHTSGIPGDVLGGAIPWGVEAKATYLASIAGLELVHPVGTHWSYCNAGWIVLGRLVEVVTGTSFGAVWRSQLIDPIGAKHTSADPVEIMLMDAAIGHVPGPDGPRVEDVYASAPAAFSAGSLPGASGADVLRFVQLHLDGGVASDGTRVISAESVAQMQEHQADLLPLRPQSTGWGLGWGLGATSDGRRMIGHGGATTGQFSTLEVLPDERLAVVVLTNGPGGKELGDVVVRELFGQLAGASLPAQLTAPEHPPVLDLALYEGTYVAGTTSLTMTVVDGALSLESRGVGLSGQEETSVLPALTPVDATTFLAGPSPMRFVEPDASGRPAYLFAGRIYQRLT